MANKHVDRICQLFDEYVNTEKEQSDVIIPIEVSVVKRLNDTLIIKPNLKDNWFDPSEWVELYREIETYITIRGYIIDDVQLDNEILTIEFREKNDGDY